MSEGPATIEAIDWKRVFPWVRLFRVFRVAIDLRMLLLACASLVGLAIGEMIFVHLPFAPAGHATSHTSGWDEPVVTVLPADLGQPVLHTAWERALTAATNWGVVLRPVRTVFDPARTILRAGADWSEKALAWTRLLWAMCLWSIFGGAMTRIAAVEQARASKVSLVASLRFSSQNFLSYMTAALLPAAGISAFWILCVIGGWIGRIPYLGSPLLGVLWGLELVFGFMMALILIGAVAGWPLMFATISTEASDGFDGFSRAYSYVYSRPWHYLWFIAVALAYGSIIVAFVAFLAMLVTYMSAAAVASGLGVQSTSMLLLGSTDAVGGPGLLTGSPSSNPANLGTILVGAWLQGVALLVAAFVTSYFWSAATAIYFLLRYVDDATDFSEVYVSEEKEADDLLPLVGVAASDQPIIERPPQGDFAATPAGPAVAPESPARPLPSPAHGVSSRTDGAKIVDPAKSPTELDPTAP